MTIHKTVKLAIGVPTAGKVAVVCAQSLIALALELTKRHLYPECESQSHFFLFQQSSVICGNRETMAERALADNATHLLFVDDDIGFPPAAVGQLAERKLPIVGANYRLRFPPAPFMARDMADQRIETAANSSGVVACDFMGFGLCLIEMAVFAALPKPWFYNEWVPEQGKHTTEDIPFFRAARRAGFPAYIDHDASKLVSHIGEYHYRYHDDFSPKTGG
jgi:hypothetical protein